MSRGTSLPMPAAVADPAQLVLRIEGRPGHRRVLSGALKDGTPRWRWERVNHPNARAHWRVKRQVALKDSLAVEVALHESGFKPQGWERATVCITLTVTSKVRRDADGFGYTIKATLDALVKASVIVDDNTAVIGTPEVRIELGPAYQYEIRVTEVRDGNE